MAIESNKSEGFLQDRFDKNSQGKKYPYCCIELDELLSTNDRESQKEWLTKTIKDSYNHVREKKYRLE
jgi:hypothetical protein